MLLYDAEIRKCIPTKEARDPRYQYCNGWTDFTRMEIGIICAYDYEKDWWHVFGNDNREDFWDLVRRHDKVVGHGSQTFDDKLVQACWPHNPMFRDDQCWDLNQAVRTSCGKFLKMNDLAMKNLGWGKTGHGADAPKLWQEGKIATVIDYCMGDVRVLKGLMDLVIRRGYLYHPTTGELLNISRP